jgi:hypothetical protein
MGRHFISSCGSPRPGVRRRHESSEQLQHGMGDDCRAIPYTRIRPGRILRGYNQGCPYVFSEYSSDGVHFARWLNTPMGCLTVGSTHQFWMPWDPNNHGYFDFNIDNINFGATAWNAYFVFDQPFVPQLGGETTYFTSEVNGTPTQTVVGSSTLLQKYDDTFTSSLPTFGSGCRWPQRYARSGMSANAFSFFTYANSSTNTNFNC